MPVARRKFTTRPIAPLSPAEVDRAAVIGERLRGELLGALASVQRSGRSALALSRDLGVDRNLSQRVVSALDASNAPLEVLARLPGVEGLRKVVAAVGRVTRRRVPGPLAAAVVEFEKIVLDLAGSQSRFLRRLEATRITGDSSASPAAAAREGHFRSAAALLGYSVDTCFVIAGLRPIASRPELIEGFNASALIGLESWSGPVTLVTPSFAMREHAGELADEVRVKPLGTKLTGSDGLIEEFCSRPLPLSSSEETDGMCRQVLDPQAAAHGRVDVVLARSWSPDSHPATSREPWWTQVVHVRRPTRRLVVDVWMPRSMAASCVPSAAGYLWSPAMTGHPRRHWHDRLPGPLTVSVLGSLANAPAPGAWPRASALTSRMFELAGWDAAVLVGHRCEVEHPVLGGAYYVVFEFERSAQ